VLLLLLLLPRARLPCRLHRARIDHLWESVEALEVRMARAEALDGVQHQIVDAVQDHPCADAF
jgi:hypothetical protein